MILSDHVQSWGKCPGCGTIIWCDVSEHDQACSCLCGSFRLRNGVIAWGESDPSFTEEDMITELQSELLR